MITLNECIGYGTGAVLINPIEIASVHHYNRMAEMGGNAFAQSRVVMRDGRRILVSESHTEVLRKIAETEPRP